MIEGNAYNALVRPRPRTATLHVLVPSLLAVFVLTHLFHASTTEHVADGHSAHAGAHDKVAADDVQSPHGVSCLAIPTAAPVLALAEAERHPSRLASPLDGGALRVPAFTAAAPTPLFLLHASLLI